MLCNAPPSDTVCDSLALAVPVNVAHRVVLTRACQCPCVRVMPVSRCLPVALAFGCAALDQLALSLAVSQAVARDLCLAGCFKLGHEL